MWKTAFKNLLCPLQNTMSRLYISQGEDVDREALHLFEERCVDNILKNRIPKLNGSLDEELAIISSRWLSLIPISWNTCGEIQTQSVIVVIQNCCYEMLHNIILQNSQKDTHDGVVFLGEFLVLGLWLF